jgi:CRISPR/Cas system-associated exonuclease Cas4 (RecB family)
VDFTPVLRQQTVALINAMQQAVALGELPAHTDKKVRCGGCSLHEICLPQETQQLQSP